MDEPQRVAANTKGRGRAYLSTGEGLSNAEGLRKIVLQHCVCYEIWPEWSVKGGRATRIGFSISLCGIHENGFGQNDLPGCGHCWGTYTRLRTIAESILPAEEALCRFEIGAFDRAWHIAPAARRSRNETVVPIKIFHRCNFDAPVDECQQDCLDEMREKLHGLGIREGVWTS